MLGLKVKKDNAEKVRKYLTGHKLMVINYRVFSSDEFIYFPISAGAKMGKDVIGRFGAEIVDARFEKTEQQPKYKEMLKSSLGKQYSEAARGYDVIGDIALIEGTGSTAATRKMAKAIMEVNRNVRTVLAKGGPVSGVYRIRKYSHVLGEKKYDTVYKENGAQFHFDIRKTFFSTRLAYERARISAASSDGENVIIMFAGVGPFAIEMAKTHKKSNIIAMELNRSAFKAMLENIKINRTANVTAEYGDVKKLVLRHRNFADRIVMPLPKDSYSFLGAVSIAARKGCVVHYYAFGKKEDAFDFNIKRIRDYFSKKGRRIRVLNKRVARNYSPSEIEVVIDFRIY